MDFVEGLPKSRGKDVVMVVVDRLTKYSHFIPLTHPFNVSTVATAYMDNVFKLHGNPMTIVSERGQLLLINFGRNFSGYKELPYTYLFHTIHRRMARRKLLTDAWKVT